MTMTAERAMPAVATPGRVGQATAVEQSRAVAEVHAAVVVAQQCPRDISAAIRGMKDSCGRMALAERAFFRYERGGDDITGPTVHLARELARCWGNIQYGVSELRRDDEHGQSEMQAWAWDVQTNARSSTTFIVPHRRDTKRGPRELTQQRDIYENNANNGARRVREMIFGVLPAWYTEEAQQMCTATLERGDGKPLGERIAECVAAFGKMGITEELLTAKAGSPLADWTPNDVAQMGVLYQSIRRGETTRDREFGDEPGQVDAATIAPRGQQAEAKAERKPRQRRQAADPAADGAERPPARAASGQVGIIQSAFKKLGYEDHEREERLVYTALLAGWPADLESTKELDQEHASRAIGRLNGIKDRAELVAVCLRLQQDSAAEQDAAAGGDKPDGDAGE